MKLKLRLFKDELPELTTYSRSYGGQWYSDWIVVFTPGSHVRTTRFVVGWSREHEPVDEESKKTGNIGAFTRLGNNAWCYSKDVEELFGVE